jgi:hypothetical protein
VEWVSNSWSTCSQTKPAYQVWHRPALIRIRNVTEPRIAFLVFQSMFCSTAEKSISLIWLLPWMLLRPYVLISTPSSHAPVSPCGFGWKEKPHSSPLSFFAHTHQISVPLVHSLWTSLRHYPSHLARYPKIPQASTTTTVFIDISIYILRRSKRQAFQQRQMRWNQTYGLLL